MSTVSKSGKTLYQLLRTLPSQGVGSRIVPNKFTNNPTLSNSYYEVTKVSLKEEGKNGRAWGVQVMKGHTMQDGKPMEIKGGLKYKWKSYEA